LKRPSQSGGLFVLRLGDSTAVSIWAASSDWRKDETVGEIKPLFALGQIVMTSGAMEAFKTTGENPLVFLLKHISGEWGDLDDHDKNENEFSVKHGFRILSAYHLQDGTKIWLITEWDRSYTTFLLPEEY
jgi:hypothetical protein